MENIEGFELQNAINSTVEGRVLVVDDDALNRTLHRALLAKQFDVVTAANGQEAIEACQQELPDLILMDIEMPGMDGIETCRHLRTWTDVPIIFATSHHVMEEHLAAYDAGGNDIVTKPLESAILLRKVALTIRQYRDKSELITEKNSLQSMAMQFLSTAGQTGALLNFMRSSVECNSHAELARHLCATISELGVNCSVMLRHDGGPAFMTSRGEASAIERSILEQSADMGRIFQFRRQLVVNYDRVSVIVSNLPEGEGNTEAIGRLSDNIAILAETAEGLCGNVDMRQESIRRAEQLQLALTGSVNAVEVLRDKYMVMLADTRMLLQELIDRVERSFSWLGTSEAQEARLNQELNASIQAILRVLAEGGDFDQQFSEVLGVLRGGDSVVKTDIELF